jgi:hypothetical protein
MVAQSTSVGATALASTGDVQISTGIDYGALAGLIGTWVGNQGFNMIALPNQQGGFGLLVAPYTETLTITAVPATTPDRGLTSIVQIPTLQYATTISDSRDNALMHVEAGFWETIPAADNGGLDIFRLATIPHGDALTAMGNSSTYSGTPNIDQSLSGVPTGALPQVNGYLDVYGPPFEFANYSPSFPNHYLQYVLDQQAAMGKSITATTELSISTTNQGGITNIAMVQNNTPTTQFDATWWIETVVDSAGNTTQQLQYSQRTLMSFPISSDAPGTTIVWPHININTLTLQS